MNKKIQEVKIDRFPMELYQFLKFTNAAQSGGEAKILIIQELVRVNGKIETRKRKKLYPNDRVELDNEDVTFVVKDG